MYIISKNITFFCNNNASFCSLANTISNSWFHSHSIVLGGLDVIS